VTVRFLEIAEIELDQAVHWYGAQAPGDAVGNLTSDGQPNYT